MLEENQGTARLESVEESDAPLVVCSPKVRTANALDAIESELNRARAKFPGGENNFAACVEEVGELAQALLKRQHEGGKSHEDVWQEAIQVAVTAIRVATEGDSSFPDYDPESGYRGKNWDGYKYTSSTDQLDAPQEQLTTEAVAEGLPLNLRCVESAYPFSVYSDGGLLCLTWASDAGGPVSGHLSPADESRLRNMLNQRHANEKEGIGQ